MKIMMMVIMTVSVYIPVSFLFMPFDKFLPVCSAANKSFQNL